MCGSYCWKWHTEKCQKTKRTCRSGIFFLVLNVLTIGDSNPEPLNCEADDAAMLHPSMHFLGPGPHLGCGWADRAHVQINTQLYSHIGQLSRQWMHVLGMWASPEKIHELSFKPGTYRTWGGCSHHDFAPILWVDVDPWKLWLTARAPFVLKAIVNPPIEFAYKVQSKGRPSASHSSAGLSQSHIFRKDIFFFSSQKLAW